MLTFFLLAAVAALVLIIYGNYYALTHEHPCPCCGGCTGNGQNCACVPACPHRKAENVS